MSRFGYGWRVAPMAVAAVLFWSSANFAHAARLTPESPEVRKAVERTTGFLASGKGAYDRLGGKGIIGLVFVKTGADIRHPRVAEAVAAIQGTIHDRKVANAQLPVYDSGLAEPEARCADGNRLRAAEGRRPAGHPAPACDPLGPAEARPPVEHGADPRRARPDPMRPRDRLPLHGRLRGDRRCPPGLPSRRPGPLLP